MIEELQKKLGPFPDNAHVCIDISKEKVEIVVSYYEKQHQYGLVEIIKKDDQLFTAVDRIVAVLLKNMNH